MQSPSSNLTIVARMKRELDILEKDPPCGITCWPDEKSLYSLTAQMSGPEDSPYNKGLFKLQLQLPERYPFEPPKVHFVTPVYHPNIDDGGRICLDLLKMPPKGSWKPSLNISTLLTSIRLLLGDPNPDDPLSDDIASEFKNNRSLFEKKAELHTIQHHQESQNELTIRNNVNHHSQEGVLDAGQKGSYYTAEKDKEKEASFSMDMTGLFPVSKGIKRSLALSKRLKKESTPGTAVHTSSRGNQQNLQSEVEKAASKKPKEDISPSKEKEERTETISQTLDTDGSKSHGRESINGQHPTEKKRLSLSLKKSKKS